MAYAPLLSLGAPKHCAPQNVMGMLLKGAPDRSSIFPSASRTHVDAAGSASVSSPQVVGMSLALPAAASPSRVEAPASLGPTPGDAPLPELHAADANARRMSARLTMSKHGPRHLRCHAQSGAPRAAFPFATALGSTSTKRRRRRA